MFSKKIATMLLSTFLMASTSIGFAANKINNIDTIKLPKEITLQNSSEKALFMGNGQLDIKQNILDRGFLGAEVYQLQYKQAENFKYGVVADIRFGVNGLRSLDINGSMPSVLDKKHVNASVAALASLINSSANNQTMNYRLITPMTAQKNGTYTGVLETTNYVDSVPYMERFHVLIYDSPYYGTAARVVALNSYDDSTLWPLVEVLNQVN